MRDKLEIQIGKSFGRLTIVSDEGAKNRHSICKCLCECGNTTIVRMSALLSGNTNSCGCLNNEVRHKLKEWSMKGTKNENGKLTSEYNIYRHMKARCYSKSNAKYPIYGGRGIKVCDRWLESFTNFLNDMGKKPSPIHSIDRINNDGNYEPTNCRWALPKEQSCNKRNNVWISFNGNKYHQAEFARMVGVGDKSIEFQRRLGKSGEYIMNHFNKA